MELSLETIEKLDPSALTKLINEWITQDFKKLLAFKHRTFNTTDLLYFIEFLKTHYNANESLENAFVLSPDKDPAARLHHFHQYFFSLPDAPLRTKKHIATPIKGSTCKRLNM